MTDEFPDEPHEFAKYFLKPHIKNGRFAFRKRDPAADVFLDELNLEIRPDGTCNISLEQSVALVMEALRSRTVQKYARIVTAINLKNNGPLPWPLKWFAAFCLLDLLPKGRQGRNRGDNYVRDTTIIFIVDHLVRRFPLRATRNDATSIDSACDVVSKVLTDLGAKLSYKTVADIHKSRLRLKAMFPFDPKKEIVRVLMEKRKK